MEPIDPQNLVSRPPELKIGSEPITSGGAPTGARLLDFWRWSLSDLLDNATRGVLAEFLVGMALGCLDGAWRTEWDAYDLETADGTTIEVKSAAYLQTWHQDKLSRISFGIAPTLGWDARTDTYSAQRKRQADVYVFCLLAHRDKQTVDPLDTDQWVFYVVPTPKLDEAVGAQATIGLSSLLTRVRPHEVGYEELAAAIGKAASWTEGSTGENR